MTPRLSVLLPAHNAAAHLPAALESLACQTMPDFELLFIDDGSTDATGEIARAWGDARLRILRNEQNLGIVASLNRGLAEAAAPWIARQDADDISLPLRFALQCAHFDEHPDCALVGTQAEEIDEAGRVLGPLRRPSGAHAIRWGSCFDNPFIHTSVLFRTETVRKAGGYPSVTANEDYALWSALIRQGTPANLPQPLVRYRAHAGSVYGSADATRRQEAALAGNGVLAANHADFLAGTTPPDDLLLAQAWRHGLTPADAPRFPDAVGRMAARFLERNPGARADAEFQTAVARLSLDAGYRLLPWHRREALGLIVRALRLCPGLSRSFPWWRSAALMLLGERAYALYRAMPRRPQPR